MTVMNVYALNTENDLELFMLWDYEITDLFYVSWMINQMEPK